MSDHYLTMLVHPGVSPEELKAKWRELSSELHPDKFVGLSEKIQRHAADRFAEVSAAYAVLKDPKSRAAYNIERAVGHDKCPDCGGAGVVAKSRNLGPREYRDCGTCSKTGLVPMRPRTAAKKTRRG